MVWSSLDLVCSLSNLTSYQSHSAMLNPVRVHRSYPPTSCLHPRSPHIHYLHLSRFFVLVLGPPSLHQSGIRFDGGSGDFSHTTVPFVIQSTHFSNLHSQCSIRTSDLHIPRPESPFCHSSKSHIQKEAPPRTTLRTSVTIRIHPYSQTKTQASSTSSNSCSLYTVLPETALEAQTSSPSSQT